jgi:hypothetical protein
VYAAQFTYALSGTSARVNGGFNRGDVTLHEHGDKTAAHPLLSSKADISRFQHRIQGLDYTH